MRTAQHRRNQTHHGSIAAHVLVAQEAERRRVSREMHDDLAQKVALLAFQIEGMKRRLVSQPQVLPELESLRGCVATLAEDVHRICFRLHPVILDNLGLVRGIEFLCDEHSRTTGVKATFLHHAIPDRLPANVALCLYRVVQEALQNAAKHSNAKDVTVDLRKIGGAIRAVVSDTGRGFDATGAGARPGLGLVFVSERVRLLGGRCAIRSTPGKGTRISVIVPVPLSQKADD
jgi:signal transduction histidine kinase